MIYCMSLVFIVELQIYKADKSECWGKNTKMTYDLPIQLMNLKVLIVWLDFITHTKRWATEYIDGMWMLIKSYCNY